MMVICILQVERAWEWFDPCPLHPTVPSRLIFRTLTSTICFCEDKISFKSCSRIQQFPEDVACRSLRLYCMMQDSTSTFFDLLAQNLVYFILEFLREKRIS
jgi:hypothetical protein